MRWLALSASIVALSSIAHADAKRSNPAFLGIGMHDMQGTPPGGGVAVGPCIVDSITRGRGATAAGLAPGDFLRAIDGQQVANCDAVLRVVQSHEPGDSVKIHVTRDGRPVQLTAELVSRDEILRRRLVGQPVVATELYAVEDTGSIDLSAMRGKTTIVGWFDAKRCTGCEAVFAKLAAWSRAQADKPGIARPMPLAVTAGEPEHAKALRMPMLEVPLALAEPSLYEEFTIPDGERIHFTVVDCRGVINYVAPVAPNADDLDAVLDELFAASEQAARRPLR
ncbi:MAG: PDZ domain-containing protein [Kofleriaceae bacterium]|nr:PDZ domain-containing protein [Kofleriaceae bacterium]